MTTKEDDFRQRFINLLTDVNASGRNDREAMWLIGSLASKLLYEAKCSDWRALKGAISPQALRQLLSSFETQGNSIAAEGQQKAVYAIQVLATSLIANTQSTPEVVAGEPLLDDVIDAAVRGFRQSKKLPANT